MLLRNDDLDRARCRPEFVAAMQDDLRWLGLTWTEPMISQSERLPRYRAALAQLHAAGLIFPCTRSRRDVLEATSAPHEGGADDEPLYPREFRPPATSPVPLLGATISVNWRFRVPDEAVVSFTDACAGPQSALASRDFGDFLVFGAAAPGFYHAPLMRDETGQRLAKRHDALALRTLRERGATPADVRRRF
jgi:glutamyl/glutaminyl-tRNA synthetase